MNLVVDMGNTRLKWATVAQGQLQTGHSLLNEQITTDTLLTRWQHLAAPQQVVIACVTATQHLEQVIAVARQLWATVKVVRVNSQTHVLGVINAYTPPEKLGVDRWLALIAARQCCTTAVCVVDCGTAITVDLMDAEGRHLGGVISAGVGLMRRSLAGGTAALPFSETAYPLAPANFTEAAIYSGTLWAAVGLIEQLLAKHGVPTVILTGGDALLIAPHLSITTVVEVDLVLRGLASVAQHDDML